MSLHVERQVVTAREHPLTEGAMKRSVTGVFPEVSGQLVRPRELPSTALPRAVVGLLAGVCPQVDLEMGALAVRLDAPGVRTGVRRLPSSDPRAASARS